ncbi:MAG: hypothetical protein AB7G93_13545 [Bdellovibrionales bacterium]
MRILRGKSDLEISSQGFALFVVGLVLATFVGGAIRTLLRSDQVHHRIISELRARFPEHQFQIGRTEVLLSRGLWPALGLRLHDLRFRKEGCDKLSFTFQVPMAVLPVDLWSLRSGQLRLGQVEISSGRMHLDYKECPRSTSTPPSPGSKTSRLYRTTSDSLMTKAKNIQPRRLDLDELSRHLDSIQLHDFAVTYERNPTWKLIFPYAELNVEDGIALQAQVDVQKSLPFGALVHSVELDAESDRGLLHWTVESHFKEGRFTWTGRWDMSGTSIVSEIQLHQFPLKDLVSDLYRMGFLEQDADLKSAWLTCTASWEGSLGELETLPVRLRNCVLEGGYGRVELAQADFYPAQKPAFRVPAQIEIRSLKIQALMEAIGRKILPRVLARLGVWSGTLVYANPEEWRLDGMLENLEVVFSNQSVRGKQLIQSLRVRAARTGDLIKSSVDDVVLRNGEFVGAVRFELNRDGRDGNFDVQIERLIFSPAIQSLLVGGELEAVSVHGRGQLQAGELHQWAGRFQLPRVSGSGWQVEGIDVKSRFTPGVFHIEGHAAAAEVNTGWRYFPRLKDISPDLERTARWRNLEARADITSSGGNVSELRAAQAPKGLAWRGQGSWVRDGEFSGFVSTGTQTRYAIQAEKGHLLVRESRPESAPQ